MAKVLVLYYSSYGHLETMAKAVAEGAREAGATVDIKRVPETVPEAIAKGAHFKLDQSAPVATVEDLANASAVGVDIPAALAWTPLAGGRDGTPTSGQFVGDENFVHHAILCAGAAQAAPCSAAMVAIICLAAVVPMSTYLKVHRA